MTRICHLYLLIVAALALAATPGLSKGLDTLSAQNPANPENQPDADEGAEDGEEAAEGTDGEQPEEQDQQAEAQEEEGEEEGEDEEEEAPPPPSEFSKSIAGKILVQTSYARVVASQSDGDWKSSGMSDISIGYKIPAAIMPGLDLFGTFRYAPFDFSAEVDNFSYRGVAEGYNFGALAFYKMTDMIDLLGSFELGYSVVSLSSVDELNPKDVPDDNGVLVNLGFGADFAMNEKFAAGPKLTIGFGQFTVFQIGGGVTMMF